MLSRAVRAVSKKTACLQASIRMNSTSSTTEPTVADLLSRRVSKGMSFIAF